MSQGVVEAIYCAERSGTAPVLVPEVEARAGRGLVGDRHYQAEGPESPRHEPANELTLIEAETIDAVLRDLKLTLDPADTRRNVLTRGVALNHLVGREFQVGPVRVFGLELCEPCGHLEKLTSPAVRKALIHRGGLRASILKDGPIRVGDPIVTDPEGDSPQ